jgi:hypothetical protein
MPDKDYFDRDWQEAELYWSLIKYTRAWWATDGARLNVVRGYQGLNTHLIRSIADEYNVVRSLPGGYDISDENHEQSQKKKRVKFTEQNDPVAVQIRTVLDAHLKEWRGDLNDKAKICITICNALRKINVSESEKEVYALRNNALSAVSKLVWFLRPAEWTMYDRFACAGLFGEIKTTNETTFEKFYGALQNVNFLGYEKTLNQHLEKTIFKGIPASRVLDTLLMERASEKTKNSGTTDDRRMMYMRGFLESLPESVSMTLRTSATAIHDAVYEKKMLRIGEGAQT